MLDVAVPNRRSQWATLMPVRRSMPRRLLIDRVLAGHRPGEVAKQLGISRQTVYKWVRRYRAEGLAGLAAVQPHPQPAASRAAVRWSLSVQARAVGPLRLQEHYNTARSHSALGGHPPSRLAREQPVRSGQTGASPWV